MCATWVQVSGTARTFAALGMGKPYWDENQEDRSSVPVLPLACGVPVYFTGLLEIIKVL